MTSISGKVRPKPSSGSCSLLNYAKMISNSRKVRPKPSDDDSGNNTSITGQHSSLISDNVDMIAQILVRLPVKYLLRSKSVSKTWLSVVTAPSFVRNYTVRNRHSVSGLFLNQEEKYEFVPLDKQNGPRRIKKGKGRKRIRNDNDNSKVTRDFSFETLKFVNVPGCIKIEQSCNGLLCCSYSAPSDRRKPELTAYYIYNPSTKSYKIVPESPFRQDGYRSVHSVSLAFDPLKSPYYELICFSSDNIKKPQMEIYSSETSSWRLCKAPFEARYNEFGSFLNLDMYKSGVFWNGSLHWESVYFDIDQELLKEMPKLPIAADSDNTDEDEDDDDSYTDDDEDDGDYDSNDDDSEDSMSVEYFGECGGHLFLVQITHPNGSFKFRILEMKTDYTGWNVKYRGNLKKMTRQYPKLMLDEYAVKYNYGLDFSILLVEEKEEEESIKMVIRVIDKVISYDLKKKRFRSIHKLPYAAGPELDSPAWFEAYQFTESLASV